MNKHEVFEKYNEVVKKGKEETEKWILSLSDDEFKLLCEYPIIVQAKIYYKKLREQDK